MNYILIIVTCIISGMSYKILCISKLYACTDKRNVMNNTILCQVEFFHTMRHIQCNKLYMCVFSGGE